MKSIFFIIALSTGCATLGDIRYSEQTVGILPTNRLSWYTPIQKVITIVNTSSRYLYVNLTCREQYEEERRLALSPNEEYRCLVRTTTQYQHSDVCDVTVVK